jgi:hypothetical protein
MPELSPAARAVLDAAEDDCIHPADLHKIVAAALEAAADQVVPEEIWLGTKEPCYAYYCQRSITRRQLLAIAAELEAHA